MASQSVVGCATEETVGIGGRGGAPVETRAPDGVEESTQLGDDAAGKDEAGAGHGFPGVVTGDDPGFDDGDAAVAAGAEAGDPDVKAGVNADEVCGHGGTSVAELSR